MKRFAMLFFFIFVSLSANGFAQKYYSLPEIKEQAKEGWHETYTDKYGREIQVDIDADVFGEQTAPLIKAGFPQYDIYDVVQNCPYDTVSNVKRKGGKRTHIYRSYGTEVDLDKPYGADYGNDLTLNEMYSFVKRILTDHGIPCDIFLYERPRFFDVLCNIQQSTGEVKATAFYLVRLYEQFYGIPVLTRKIASFNTKRGWPDYEPNISFQMRNENEFTAMVNVLEEQEIIAEDIPLCSIEQIINSIEKEIKDGYIQSVYSLQFGYVVYSDPNISDWTKSELEDEIFYLVPSWVAQCIFSENPKIWNSDADEEVMKSNEDFDTRKKGGGDGAYKDVILWSDIK